MPNGHQFGIVLQISCLQSNLPGEHQIVPIDMGDILTLRQAVGEQVVLGAADMALMKCRLYKSRKSLCKLVYDRPRTVR